MFKKLLARTALTIMLGVSPVMADTIYNITTNSLATNVPSLGYQAISASQVGDEITFGGVTRTLGQVVVTMSSWALFSAFPSFHTCGYDVPMTFSIYKVDTSGPNSAVGSLVASRTIDANIDWRPAATAGCGTGFAGVGGCFNGLAQNVHFDFSGVVVPNSIIYGLSFSTVGDVPQDSLNIGVTTDVASRGTNVEADSLFWSNSNQALLTTGSANVFGRDTGWSGYTPMVKFESLEQIPEPASIALLGFGLMGLIAVRRKNANDSIATVIAV